MTDGGISLEDIGIRLVALREARGMNQSAFAKWLGFKSNALSNWEHGTKRPDLSNAIRIKTMTGATLDWIYAGDRSGLPVDLANRLPDLSDRFSKQRA